MKNQTSQNWTTLEWEPVLVVKSGALAGKVAEAWFSIAVSMPFLAIDATLEAAQERAQGITDFVPDDTFEVDHLAATSPDAMVQGIREAFIWEDRPPIVIADPSAVLEAIPFSITGHTYPGQLESLIIMMKDDEFMQAVYRGPLLDEPTAFIAQLL